MKKEISFGKVSLWGCETRQDLKQFLQVAHKVYQNDPHWVAPLDKDFLEFVNPEKNPFFRKSKVQFFIAYKEGQPVGRIAAVLNGFHNQFYQDRSGFFGFFESIRNADVTKILLDGASQWLSDQGADTIYGPMNFTMNDDFGWILPQSKTRLAAPKPLQPYNPDYYPRLIEKEGFSIYKKCYSYSWKSSAEISFKESYPEVRFRKIHSPSSRLFWNDVQLIHDLYHLCWKKNWGYYPSDLEDQRFMAKRLKSILDPNLVYFAEHGTQTVGMVIALPNVNEFLRVMKGKLRWWKVPQAYRKMKMAQDATFVALGLDPEWRNSGLADCLLNEVIIQNPNYRHFETNWVLEDNVAIQRILEQHFLANRVKEFGVFGKSLGC